MSGEGGSEKALRLDKWLWYARFFKTRANASKAISGGRFRLDGEVMSKPHRAAQPGQVLTFMQGERVRVIRIVALGSRRGPAIEAAELYEDMSPEMPSRRKDAEAEPQFELREKGAASSWLIDTDIYRELGFEGFRYFRIMQTSKNSSGSDNLALSGFELYGSVTKGRWP